MLLASLVSGCISWPGPPAPAPERPPTQIESRFEDRQTSPERARARFEEVALLVEQTRELRPEWEAADPLTSRAHAALEAARWSEALALTEEADAQARIAISDYYARMANAELARVNELIGLGEQEQLELRAAEEMLVTGNSRLAYGRLRTLNRTLEDRANRYEVRAGDSLWVISSRPEGYSNPLLWPLIWHANISVIPNPNRLRHGQVLEIKQHPTAADAAAAVAHARGERPAATVAPTIGPIRRGRDE